MYLFKYIMSMGKVLKQWRF